MDYCFLKTTYKVLRLCVPEMDLIRTKMIEEFHDSPIAEHPGARRTYLRIAQWFYWKSMETDIQEYVIRCESCVGWKLRSAKSSGKFMPLPIPEYWWDIVSLDFVNGLPMSNGFDAIFTVLCKLSKRTHYGKSRNNDNAEKTLIVF